MNNFLTLHSANSDFRTNWFSVYIVVFVALLIVICLGAFLKVAKQANAV